MIEVMAGVNGDGMGTGNRQNDGVGALQHAWRGRGGGRRGVVVEGKKRESEVRRLTCETGDGDNVARHIGADGGDDEPTSNL